MQEIFTQLHLDIIACHFSKITTEWNDVPLHYDIFSRLYLVTGGQGRMTCRNEELRIRPGQLYLIPGGEHFCHHPSPGLEHYWVHFIARSIMGLNLFELVKCPLEKPVQEMEKVRARLEKMVNLFRRSDPAAVLEQQALLRIMLADFFQEEAYIWRTNYMNGLERFSPTLAHIEKNLDQELFVSDLAEIVHLHPTYYSNLFTKQFGLSPKHYILKKRIEKAQELLWHTDESLKRIAGQIGYEDESYFSRIFRKYTGLTPGQFRKRRELVRLEAPVSI